jgi:hypothetical protein
LPLLSPLSHRKQAALLLQQHHQLLLLLPQIAARGQLQPLAQQRAQRATHGVLFAFVVSLLRVLLTSAMAQGRERA